jgi:hypothetical protein
MVDEGDLRRAGHGLDTPALMFHVVLEDHRSSANTEPSYSAS